MFSLLFGFRSLVKRKSVVTEGPVFQLHCRWTVLFLVCSSVLLTCRQYFGDPILCIQNDVKKEDASRSKTIESFCWIHATFILPEAWNGTVGDDIPHPGIATHKRGKAREYVGYYQWVALFFLMQSVLFYIPKYLWKTWEKGTMKNLVLNLHQPLLPQEQAEKNITLLVNSLKSHWGHFGPYLRSYIICEVLNLVNIGGQILLIDAFLGGSFTTFGIKVLQWSEWDQVHRKDPLIRAFPRMTKCEFFEFGSSGDIQRRDALCVLPLNILNEKIVIFLWFWFVILCGITAVIILYRFVLANLPMLRYCILVTRAPKANKGALDKILMKSTMGDWFIMYLLAKNLDSIHYRSVVGQLAAALMQNGHLSSSLMTIPNKEKLDFV